MKKLLFSILFCCATLFSTANAQNRIITGNVSSEEDGLPLPGVNVLAAGSNIGAFTDIDGNYSIEVPNQTNVLVFSYVGFLSKEVEIQGRNTLNVLLSTNQEQLQEVVITGYGDRDRASYTGSASVLNATEIEDKPFSNVEQVLQGNVAGVSLSASSGTPGSVQDIRIRGISSITAGNSPLFVIDGVPVVNGTNQSSGNLYGNLSALSSLSSNDIASITVLKDASATALYGARGANGVIVITTKKGKEGKPTFTFSNQIGTVDRAVDGPQMLNAEQYAELHYESRVNAGQAPNVQAAQDNFPLPWDGVTTTDWLDVVTRDNAMSQTYDLSVRGGKDGSNYYMSLGHFAQDGVNIGVDFERTTAKINYQNDITDKLKIGTSITGSFIRQNGQMEGNSFFGNPDAAVIFLRSIFSPYNDDGSLNLDDFPNFYNPIYQAENAIHQRDQSRLITSTNLEYKITDNLKFTSILGLDFLYTEELNFDPREHGDGANVNGFSFGYTDRNFNWTWKNMLDYNWRISDDHNVDFKLVYEAQQNRHNSLGAGGSDIAADGLYYPSSVANLTFVSGAISDWAINSILGTVAYSFKDKIFIDGSFRREGNSRFAEDYRWGSFYSVGAAWAFNRESFLENSTWLSNGKLRFSYGKIGNAGIGLNQYQALLNYGATYNNQAGSFPSQLGNNQLGWENSHTWNVGLDFGLFNDRVSGSVEYFYRNTFDLLLDVPITTTSGFASQTRNVGEMVNKGLEVTLNADIIKSEDFTWNLGFNLTTLENEVTSLPRTTTGEEIGITTARSIVTEGEPVFSWYLPTWAGVDPQTGSPLWYVEGQSGETTSIYSQAGSSLQGSTFPTLYGGVQTRLSFKGFYLNANLYYSTGNKIYDVFALYGRSDGRFPVYNKYASQMDRWQQPGDISDNPRNVFQNNTFSSANSTRNLHDGEFLRLRDLTLGYSFPTDLISGIGLAGLNVYLKGTNILTYVKDKDLEHDPEVGADGLVLLNAPALKSYVIGFNVSF